MASEDDLAERLKQESPEFRAWVETLPDTHWAKYDLSACRLGWEAGRAALQQESPRAEVKPLTGPIKAVGYEYSEAGIGVARLLIGNWVFTADEVRRALARVRWLSEPSNSRPRPEPQAPVPDGVTKPASVGEITSSQRRLLELATREPSGNPWPLIGLRQRGGGATRRMFEGMKKLGYFDARNCITPAGRAALTAANERSR